MLNSIANVYVSLSDHRFMPYLCINALAFVKQDPLEQKTVYRFNRWNLQNER